LPLVADTFLDSLHWVLVVVIVAIGLATDGLLRALGRLRYRAAWWLRIGGNHVSDWVKARRRK
jgi:hypothetical protein